MKAKCLKENDKQESGYDSPSIQQYKQSRKEQELIEYALIQIVQPHPLHVQCCFTVPDEIARLSKIKQELLAINFPLLQSCNMALYIQTTASKLNSSVFFPRQQHQQCGKFLSSPKETVVCCQAYHKIQQFSPLLTSM